MYILPQMEDKIGIVFTASTGQKIFDSTKRL